MGHQGLTKTKKLLRERVFFFGIDRLVEQVVKECPICELNYGPAHFEPMPTTTTTRPRLA
jgi:hypothetical protein